MRDSRPDPDALLKEIQQSEVQTNRGKLKVFLGASAGVGKTYAMLSEARERLAKGVDVVAGYVETHGRKETDELAEGFPSIPIRQVRHRDTSLREFDLDAALKRKPQLVLVDELAHTNAPGSRHPKRWQDIEELLNSGINVYSTVNIQHLESLNDSVAQITGILVRETVPDSVLERADEIELVDIPPDELLQRLKDGKVYVPERIEQALAGFFQKGNLMALRELALRRTADRVDAQIQSYRTIEGVQGLWPTRERVIVCIAPNRLAERVVRSASRIGATTHAEMIAVYVESDRQVHRSAESHQRAQEALRLAETLGMETATLSGYDIAGEVLQFAQSRNATLIVVGKPIRPRWREYLFGSVVDEMVRRSGAIDVHVITGEPEATRNLPRVLSSANYGITAYIWTLIAVGIATGVCALMKGRFDLSNLVMVYLVAVMLVSARFGPAQAVLASILSVASFDFFFVSPHLTFAVADSQYLVTFGVMLGVALLISSLTQRLKRQALASAARERRTAALYELSRDISRIRNTEEIAQVGARKIREVFDVDAGILLPYQQGKLRFTAMSRTHFEKQGQEQTVAEWVLAHNQPAGADTDTLPGSTGLYLPLRGSRGAVGVLGVLPERTERLEPQQRVALETFANGLGLAIERTILAKESHEARLQAETEKLRSTLLSSVSHDLRTPLTAIAGAASSLVEQSSDKDSRSQELARMILEEAERLNSHIVNLLDMTRLESGGVELKLEWQSVEELVGAALNQLEPLLRGREVRTAIPDHLPLIKVDGPLAEKVFFNLLENAARHTPDATPIEIEAEARRDYLEVRVRDHGAGIIPGSEATIFEKFSQGTDAGGFGLGLAICKAILDAHGGFIQAANHPDGGAVFTLRFPLKEKQPEVPRG